MRAFLFICVLVLSSFGFAYNESVVDWYVSRFNTAEIRENGLGGVYIYTYRNAAGETFPVIFRYYRFVFSEPDMSPVDRMLLIDSVIETFDSAPFEVISYGDWKFEDVYYEQRYSREVKLNDYMKIHITYFTGIYTEEFTRGEGFTLEISYKATDREVEEYQEGGSE